MALPTEIRVEIYRYLIVCPTYLYRSPSRTTASPARIGKCGSGVVYRATIPDRDLGKRYEWNEDSHHAPPLPGLAILTISRQIHAEARVILYGENRFRLSLGISPHTRCRKHVWDLVDDISSINCNDLRNIKMMRIEVRIFDDPGPMPRGSLHNIDSTQWWWPDAYARDSYLAVRGRLKAFADVIRQENNLRVFVVAYEGFVPLRPSRRDRLQNVLEPLSSIYGIPVIGTQGVTPDFRAKLVRAMRASSLMVEEIPDAYGTRRLKGAKPTKAGIPYRLGPYYKSKYIFH